MKVEGRRPYRQSARAEAAEQTGRRILDAAVALFWERPTDSVSLEDVAARSGVTVPTVLRRFGSKDGLFAAAAAREAERVTAQRGVARPGDVEDTVRVLLDHYDELGDAVLRLLVEAPRNPGLAAVVEQGNAVHIAWCTTVFADALAARTGRDRARLLAQLVAVCDVQTWALLRRRSLLSRPQTHRALVELLSPLLIATPTPAPSAARTATPTASTTPSLHPTPTPTSPPNSSPEDLS